MPDLQELCGAAVDAAVSAEAVEAYAEESRHTEASALRGEIEGLTFAESRGVGVRLISGGRLGYAYAADPTLDEVRDAVGRARENAALTEPDEFNVLPAFEAAPSIDGLYRADQADVPTDRKVALALDLERRATSIDPRVTKIDAAQIGDAVSKIAIASTTGVQAEYARTDAWCVAVALAVDAEETQTGFSFALARGIDELGWEAIASEAVERSVRMLGARKPATARLPVVLDQFAAMSFLGVLAGALSAEAVLKGRSLFATMAGQHVGSDLFTLVDDGTITAGPAAAPFDDEGVPSGRTELFTRGTLNGFLHNTYTAARTGGGTLSTGNAKRGGYKTTPGVGTSNFYVDAGDRSFDELLARAEGGVLIQEVSGVHSGANPISGEFSVGATGLRIAGGALGEPLREMTIASTLPEDMLAGITGVGDDLRFFSSVGTPSILIGEMTLAGVWAGVGEIRIGKAGLDRLDELEGLWVALHEHQTAVDPGIEGIPPRPAGDTWPLRRANYVRWLGEDPDAFVLIAEDGDAGPVAYALVSIQGADDTHVTGDRIAELQTLSVLPSHRNAGLGSRMMEAVFAELRSLGIHELVIAMIATNEPARRFYERFGFRPWLTVAFGKVPPAAGTSSEED